MSDVEDRESRADSDSEEDSEEEEDDIIKKLKLAQSEMKRIFNGTATKEDAEAFIDQHGEVVSQVGEDEPTFLHIIVGLVNDKKNEMSVNAQDVQPLVERMLHYWPDLLRTLNEEGQNPLYKAIHLKRYTWRMIEYMLDACDDQQAVHDALELPCGKGESMKTCLTLAFEKDLKGKVLEKLISCASDNALNLRDGTNRSPFHYAVEYSQCTDDRVGVIERLLERDSKAVNEIRARSALMPLDTFLDGKYVRTEDKVEYSVYGEHKRSKDAYLASELARKEREAKQQREAEHERGDGKAPNISIVIREKEPPKASLREKDPKSRAAPERDHKKAAERDRERRKPEAVKLDENERLRQQLRERERERLRQAEEQRGPLRDAAPPAHEQARARQMREPKERTREESPGIPKIVTNAAGTDHAPNTPLKRVSTQMFKAEEKPEKKEKKEKKPSSKSASKKPEAKVLAKNSAVIVDMLKLHYMRTRSIKMATSFLYGKNIQEDIQICFDYEGLPSEIQDTVFLERFGKDPRSGIRFDEVLMYVRFPIVTVNRTGRRAPKPRAAGRQDMEFFFDWLYTKGVRRILKVEIDDSAKVPHSDEAIQISLGKIIVEHLDWQKMDLDPRVICRAGSQAIRPDASEDSGNELREVTLKWSGNNAVLRAWSELEGLPQLPVLRVVNLSIPSQADLYDTKAWVQENLKEFRSRLNKNANIQVKDVVNRPGEDADAGAAAEPPAAKETPERKIDVVVREGTKGIELPVSSAGASKSAGRTNPMTEHEWITCMERFSGSMDLFWKRTVAQAEEKLQQDFSDSNPLLNVDMQHMADLQKLKKDVVVALIDDGVDSCDSAFAGRVIEGKTFDYQDGGVGQYYISARGHGTEMARMILKVCPMASIYSIRLKTHTSPTKGHSTIDPISAALAIEAALEKKATIISMSWTIPEPPEGSEEKKLLDSVLERACSQKVLMFCSSSDQISATKHYPSAYKRQRFFLIGAAHDDGTAFGHAGKDNDFIFPGVNVNTSGGSSLAINLADKTSSTKESTGSSIATALAAGLAALITYCFKASAVAIVTTRLQQGKDYAAGTELVRPEHVDKIVEHEVLKTAFAKIGEVEAGAFIPVWKRFSGVTLQLESETNTYDAKLTHVMNLCSNLIER
ncbi:hypothetical protein B0I35DRAFT_357913 [Stachybotrys elegans]|uniref:Peptidase S8/S53 domain-containing protein n=1 Tax=Stachybotrys elegans TaxID=80388 RepID=A0A8K0WNL6_9HYPO|nr:hypothetical protein B0I35DRAFT_357913 [Stachybotrys elegans]